MKHTHSNPLFQTALAQYHRKKTSQTSLCEEDLKLIFSSEDDENNRSPSRHNKRVTAAKSLQQKEIPIELSVSVIASRVMRVYSKHFEIKSLWSWQMQCLNKQEVAKGGNLLISTPTSSGKSLVAEVWLLNKLYLQKYLPCFGIYLLPFISVVQQKAKKLRNVAGLLGIEIVELYGDYSQKYLHLLQKGQNSRILVLCTFERAWKLLRVVLLMKVSRYLRCMVVDELHLIGQDQRGGNLELILSTFLYFQKTKDFRQDCSIIGMSATLPNLSELASWLNAELYVNKFRPQKVQEFIMNGGRLFISRDPLPQSLFDLEIAQTYKENN